MGIYCSLRLLNFYIIYLYGYHTDMSGPVLSKLFVRYNTPVPWSASPARAKIMYRCIASKNRFLNRLYRFIARNLATCIASSPGKSYYLEICIASSVTKILAQKIVSLYSIFFSKIVYLYRFKRYIFEYRCPPLVKYGKVMQNLPKIRSYTRSKDRPFLFTLPPPPLKERWASYIKKSYVELLPIILKYVCRIYSEDIIISKRCLF